MKDLIVQFRLYKANPTIERRNYLVVQNICLTAKVASEIHQKSPFVEYEELHQVACLSLVVCVEEFKPDMGFQFSSFAIPKMRGVLLNWVRDKGHLIRVPRTYYDIAQGARRLERDLIKQGYKPTTVAIAQLLNIAPELLIASKRSLVNCRILGSDIYRDMSPPIFQESEEKIKVSLSGLSDLEKQALILFFDPSQKLSEIAKILQIKPSKLKIFLREAIQKVKVFRKSVNS